MATINRISNCVSAFVFGCALFVLGFGFIREDAPRCFIVQPTLRTGNPMLSPRESLQALWKLPSTPSSADLSPRDALATGNTAPAHTPGPLIVLNTVAPGEDAPVVEIVASSPAEEAVSQLADLRLVPESFRARLPFKSAELILDQAAAKALSITSLAQDKKFLEAAWISYDAGKKLWKATWQKPPMFHFGMVLLPAIVEHLKAGEMIKFEAKGKPMLVSKTDSGQLVLNNDGATSALGSKLLRDLLESQVHSDGLSLYLDKSGNLVLQANGQRAEAMASVRSQ
jgi:hypothetical protein